MAVQAPVNALHVIRTSDYDFLQDLNSMNNYVFPDLNTINDVQQLVVSPYTEAEHLLNLQTVDPQSRLLAKALASMRALKTDFAMAPYADSFNWSEIISNLRNLVLLSGTVWKEQRWFIVAFRSQIPPTTNYGDLGALDKAAHIEATASGGFLKYWFGNPDAEGRNLATCLWCSQEDARKGGVGPNHRKAAGAARHTYSSWEIERIALVVKDGVKEWQLVPWVDE